MNTNDMNGRKLVLRDFTVELLDSSAWHVGKGVSTRNSSSNQKPYGTNPNSRLKKLFKLFSTFGNACNPLKISQVGVMLLQNKNR